MALEDLESYRIISELDGTAIDLKDWNIANGAIVISGKDAANENQMWVAELEDEGYQFRGKVQHGRAVKVLTEDEGDKIIHKIFESSENQEWILEQGEEEGKYYIKGKGSGKYLKNSGIGEQLVTSEKCSDKSQLWHFVVVP